MVAGRKPWVGGNWKCNGTKKSIETICDHLKSNAKFNPDKIDVVVCPTALHVDLTSKLLSGGNIQTCLQNVCDKNYGAYTGEICVDMMGDYNIKWTLLGHSERRQLYHESDDFIASKLTMCQKHGVCTAVCIGETLEERKSDKTETVLKKQLDHIISAVKDWSKVVIAYEPIWAIGTGVVATPEIAQSTHKMIRKYLEEKKADKNIRIVYGGSVNGANSADLAKQEDIDGFLVGGASLKPEFTTIIQSLAQ